MLGKGSYPIPWRGFATEGGVVPAEKPSEDLSISPKSGLAPKKGGGLELKNEPNFVMAKQGCACVPLKDGRRSRRSGRASAGLDRQRNVDAKQNDFARQ